MSIYTQYDTWNLQSIFEGQEEFCVDVQMPTENKMPKFRSQSRHIWTDFL